MNKLNTDTQLQQTIVSRSVFLELLSGKIVKYFSTESAGDFNWQGLQNEIRYSSGKIERTENEELILIDGRDEYVLDFEDYVGSATDGNDDTIANSFFFADSHLVVVLN